MISTVEYSKVDRLIYLVRDTGRFPIAFAGMYGDHIRFTKFTDTYSVKAACKEAYILGHASQFIDENTARCTIDDITKLYKLTTKRVCYFVRNYDTYFVITKVENIKRNSNPDNVLGTWRFEKDSMRNDFRNAIQGLLQNAYVPATKYGVYLPVPFANHIILHAPFTKPDIFDAPDRHEVNYWLHIDNNGEEPELVVEQHIGDKFAGMTYIATIKPDRSLIIYDEFTSADTIIRRNFSRMKPGGGYHMSKIDGEYIWRAYEASKIANEVKPSEPEAYIKAEIKPLTITSRTILI